MRKKWIARGCAAGTAAVCAVMLAGSAGVGGAVDEPMPVTLCAVELGAVEQVLEAGGTVRGVEEFAVLYPASGTVAQVYVKPGDRVEKGQALFRMDAELQEQTVAALIKAEATPDELTKKASALLDVSEDALDSRISGKISIEDAIRKLEAMTARAPTGGVVRQVNAARYGGGMAGSPAVSMSSEESKIVLHLVPCEAARVKAGMQARISVDGGEETSARVTQVGEAAADPITGRMTHEVTLAPDARLNLPLGTQVDVSVILESVRDVPVLPSTVLTAERTVWWIADGRAWETPVDVVMQNGRECWVDMQQGLQVVDMPDRMLNGQRISEVRP